MPSTSVLIINSRYSAVLEFKKICISCTNGLPVFISYRSEFEKEIASKKEFFST